MCGDDQSCGRSKRILRDGTECWIVPYGVDGFEIVVGNWSVYQNPHLKLKAARDLLHTLSDYSLLTCAGKREKLSGKSASPRASWSVQERERLVIRMAREYLNSDFERLVSRVHLTVKRTVRRVG